MTAKLNVSMIHLPNWKLSVNIRDRIADLTPAERLQLVTLLVESESTEFEDDGHELTILISEVCDIWIAAKDATRLQVAGACFAVAVAHIHARMEETE